MFVDQLKVVLPDQFPLPEYTEFTTRAHAVLHNPKGQAWAEYAGAANLIGFRFRSTFEALDSYSEWWERHGDHCDHEELYHRERSLFVMFASGVSCIESACYAIYAAMSDPKVLAIQFGEKEQKATPGTFRNVLVSAQRPQPCTRHSIACSARRNGPGG